MHKEHRQIKMLFFTWHQTNIHNKTASCYLIFLIFFKINLCFLEILDSIHWFYKVNTENIQSNLNNDFKKCFIKLQFILVYFKFAKILHYSVDEILVKFCIQFWYGSRQQKRNLWYNQEQFLNMILMWV